MKYLYPLPFLLLVIINIILLSLRIKVSVEYIRNEYADNFSVSFYAVWGIFRYKYEVPMINQGNEGLKFRLVREKRKKEQTADEEKKRLKITDIPQKFEEISNYFKNNSEFICEIRDFLCRRLVLHKFRLNIVEGAGCADHTGIICGLLWSAAGVFISFLSAIFKTCSSFEKSVSITPDFKKNVLHIDFKCIFLVRIVHIIVLLAKIYFYMRKKERKSRLIRKNRHIVKNQKATI